MSLRCLAAALSAVALSAGAVSPEAELEARLPGLLATAENDGQGRSATCADQQVRELCDSTVAYRKTGLVRHLADARRLADSVVASAANRDPVSDAAAAAALMELSQYVGASDRRRYRSFAVNRLLVLSSPERSAASAKTGFFKEALRRFRALRAGEAARAGGGRLRRATRAGRLINGQGAGRGPGLKVEGTNRARRIAWT